MLVAGIDGGSRAIKIVIFDTVAQCVAAQGSTPQGVNHDARARALFERLLRKHKLAPRRVKRVVATGYTREGIGLADKTITEITCHARGVHHQAPRAMTVIEVGGQDSKVLWLAAGGAVRDFAMNDRCAAGTGRFLEMVAARFEMDVAQLGRQARRSRKPAAISSMCAVFAETEIIGLLSAGVPEHDIVAGVQNALCSRLASMAARKLVQPVAFTGGVARVSGMPEALSIALECPVEVPTDPEYTGALGAALLANGD